MAEPSVLDIAGGRQLEYLVGGATEGPVLLFHVGTPNAGLLYRAVTEPAAAAGLRVVTYSRPGYGSSAPQPGRTVSDAVSDVEALLDHLGVGGFFTLGWSGGGPHALACAARLPDRCLGAAILAGVAPYPARGIDFLAGMDEMNVAEFTAAFAGEAELTAFLTPVAPQLAGVTGQGIAESMAGLLSAVDRESLTESFAADSAAAMRRSVAQGIAGWRDDDLAFVRPWGFDLAEIGVPVSIWQGRQDRMVPFEHGQWLAASIPGAEAHLFAAEGHLSLILRLDEVLADLITP